MLDQNRCIRLRSCGGNGAHGADQEQTFRYCDVTIWMNGNDNIQATLKAW